MKYLQVEIPVLQVVPRRHAEAGTRLEKSVFTPDGRVLAEGQTELTENLLQKFENFKVRNLVLRVKQKHWLSEPEAQNLPPEAEIIEEEEFSEAAEEIIASVRDTNSVRKMRKVAEFLESQARRGGDDSTVQKMDDIIERSYELENKIEKLTAQLEQVDDPEARNKIMNALEGAISELEETFLEIAAPDNILNSTLDVVNEREDIKSSITDFINNNQQFIEDSQNPEDKNKLDSTKISKKYETVIEEINRSNPIGATEELEKQANDSPSRENLQTLKKELSAVEEKKNQLKDELTDECTEQGPRKHLADMLEGRVKISREKLEAMPISEDFARKSYEFVEEKEKLHKKLWDAANEVSEEEFENNFDREEFQNLSSKGEERPDFLTNSASIDSPEGIIDEEELEKIITAFERNNVQGGIRVLYSRTKQSDNFGASMLGQLDLTRQNITDLTEQATEIAEKLPEQIDNNRSLRMVLKKLANSEPIKRDELLEMKIPEEIVDDIVEFEQNRTSQGTRVENALNELSNGLLDRKNESAENIYEGIKYVTGGKIFQKRLDNLTDQLDGDTSDSKFEQLMAEKDPYDLADYADMDVQTVRSALHTLTLPEGLSGNQQVLLEEIKRMIELILYNNKLPEGELISLIDRTESILRDNNRPIKLLAQPPDGERYLLSHSLNTYLISFLLGMELDFSDDKILELAGAAICQDLGMTEIPMGLWAKKEGELTGRGWQEIQKHPLHTVQILEDTVGQEDPMVDLACQHHEHRDGSGYPRGITIEEQHPLAPVLRVADAYTAMLEERPHRSGLSPDEVLLTMLKNDDKFDRTVVNSMLKIIGFYPTGSVVLLKDRRLGLVRQQNDGEPLAPKLFILTDEQRNKLQEPRPADLTEDELDIHQVVKF